jgi:hypothetical protein
MSFTKDRTKELFSLLSTLTPPTPPPTPPSNEKTTLSTRNELIIDEVKKALRALDKTVKDIEEKVRGHDKTRNNEGPKTRKDPKNKEGP